MVALPPRVAAAQAASADVSLARQLGNEGLALAERGDCAGAVEKLKRAEGLFHAPTTLTVLGECHLAVGKLVDGVEELTRVAREELPANAPPAFRKAQARARQKLEAARPRLPKIRLTVDGVRGDALVAIRIDGQSVPSAVLDLDRPIDPGPHDVEVSATGYRTATAHFVAKEGASQPVKVTLEEIPAPPPEPPASAGPVRTAAPLAQESAAPGERKASYVPAYVLFGVAAAGVGVGTVFGIAALNKASHLSAACQPRSACPSDEQGEIDSANASALASTVGFGVAIASAAVGTYFLFAPPTTERATASTKVTLHPWIGPAAAGVSGAF
jgi:hypothetical protein